MPAAEINLKNTEVSFRLSPTISSRTVPESESSPGAQSKEQREERSVSRNRKLKEKMSLTSGKKTGSGSRIQDQIMDSDLEVG